MSAFSRFGQLIKRHADLVPLVSVVTLGMSAAFGVGMSKLMNDPDVQVNKEIANDFVNNYGRHGYHPRNPLEAIRHQEPFGFRNPHHRHHINTEDL